MLNGVYVVLATQRCMGWRTRSNRESVGRRESKEHVSAVTAVYQRQRCHLGGVDAQSCQASNAAGLSWNRMQWVAGQKTHWVDLRAWCSCGLWLQVWMPAGTARTVRGRRMRSRMQRRHVDAMVQQNCWSLSVPDERTWDSPRSWQKAHNHSFAPTFCKICHLSLNILKHHKSAMDCQQIHRICMHVKLYNTTQTLCREEREKACT